jgi:hypothetical protein
MRLDLALEGRLEERIARDRAVIVKAGAKAAKEVADTAKLAAREVINRRFRGSQRVKGGARRVANAIRSKVYENADGSATGLVFSKFGRRRGAEFVDYLLPFVTGETIKPRNSKWLYVPIGGGRRNRQQRRQVGREKGVEFVPLSGGRVLIVKRTRTRSTVIGLLVRELRRERSLDFAAVAAKAEKEIAAAFARRLVELGD